ncbi:MAG TPA: amidohydrolase family protein [Xanthobacteraceae bacterium]|jgi:predicted TIM-barrel fold metal-dependent hydrolase|nr:amidohydrolase family protein [Xanthobacteraceae bacterium]
MTIRADDLTPTIAPPDPNPKKPRITLPTLACDSHFHVFGPHSKFPYAPNRPFTPTDAPKENLFRLHNFLGFQRGVFVQSTCHGSDHAALVDLLAAGEGRYRGVALLEPTMRPEEIERLDDAGVRGLRLHFYFPHLGAPRPREEMLKMIELAEPYGWHIAIHCGGNGVFDLYEFIRSIDAPVVIDHIGRVDVGEGKNGRAFATLRRLLDTGNVWVKLSGTDRITKQPYPYADAVPFARDLAAHAPERVVWGTDWPHPNHKAIPNDGELVDLIAEIAPDEKTRRLMLVDNPTKLFGF